MKKLALVLSMALAVLFVGAPIFAHHGETNYDTEKLVSVKATVTSFEFINPHTQITLEAKNDKGDVEKWTCEARSPAMLVRNGGWDKNTLSLSASATGTDRYLDPPVLQNYTSHGTPADFMAHYERDLIDNDRIGIILRREQSKFLVPIGISRSVDARLQFEF